MCVDKTVATIARTTDKGCFTHESMGMRKIQSNPPIIRHGGEMEVDVNDEVNGSIPFIGSNINKSTAFDMRCFYLYGYTYIGTEV